MAEGPTYHYREQCTLHIYCWGHYLFKVSQHIMTEKTLLNTAKCLLDLHSITFHVFYTWAHWLDGSFARKDLGDLMDTQFNGSESLQQRWMAISWAALGGVLP